jgi:hypothetical protein
MTYKIKKKMSKKEAEKLQGIAKVNPILFRTVQKSNSVEEFINKMSKGKPKTVDKQVLTDFYNRVKLSTSNYKYLKKKLKSY